MKWRIVQLYRENLFLDRSVIFVEKYRRVISNAIQLIVWNDQVIGGTIISFRDRLPREQKLKANWLFVVVIIEYFRSIINTYFLLLYDCGSYIVLIKFMMSPQFMWKEEIRIYGTSVFNNFPFLYASFSKFAFNLVI